MSRMIFVNLAVDDLDRSKRFFGDLGFSFNPQFTDENAACMVVDDNAFVMLLVRAFFENFVTGEISDPHRATEVLVALSCDSREQVDDTLAKALAGGAKPWKPTMQEGPMYGASFQDPDGHVWELVHMQQPA